MSFAHQVARPLWIGVTTRRIQLCTSSTCTHNLLLVVIHEASLVVLLEFSESVVSG